MLGNLDFRNLLIDLEQYGWFQYVFPFLLVYAIVFTILNQVKLFEERKSVRIIIALVIALFAIAFPITGDAVSCGIGGGGTTCQTLGDFMMALFPGVTAFTMGILALYIVAAMLGVDLMKFFEGEKENKWIKYILGGLGVFVVVFYYAKGFGWTGLEGSFIADIFSDPLLYIIILFGVIFYMITKEELTEEQKARIKAEKAAKSQEKWKTYY